MSTEIYERAAQTAKQVLAGVRPEQLGDPTPCASWDVAALVNHLVGGGYFFAAATEAGEYTGGDEGPDFSAGDFVAAYEEASKQAAAAFAAPGAGEKLLKLPFGEMPGAAFMQLATTDTLVHAWDLAKATGQDTDLDPELAERQLEFAKAAVAPHFRGDEPMPFGPEQEAPEGACAAERLAAFLGRKV